MDQKELLSRITVNPAIFGGKPVMRGRRLAVEHVLGMLAAGASFETLLEGFPWLEREDVQACLAYAQRIVGHERIELIVEDHAGPRGSHESKPTLESLLKGVTAENLHGEIEYGSMAGDETW